MFTLQVGPEHEGQYQCQPFNKRGSEGKSPPIQVIIKDPPTLLNRPNAEYIKNIGGSVSFSCLAAGTPKPEIRWRRVSRNDRLRIASEIAEYYSISIKIQPCHRRINMVLIV